MNNSISTQLSIRKTYLYEVRRRVEDFFQNHQPKGRIRVSHCRNHPQYYLVSSNGSKNGKYLKKNELSIASEIVQADYYSDVLDSINQELHAITCFEKTYSLEKFEDIYAHLHDDRKKLINPVIDTDDIFLQKWLESHPDYLNTYKFPGEFFTIHDAEVRSKTEKNIADALIRYGVPFRYECEMKFNGRLYYPDFTCLNIRTRQTWIWDHSGLLTKYRYAADFCERAEMYEKLGYYWGDGLIVTVESDEKALNTKTIDSLIKRYLL